MKNTKKASITLYVLVLIIFAMTLAYIVLSNMETMNNKLKVSELTEQEKYVLSQNAELNLQNNLKVNKDWNWFEDSFSCPTVTYQAPTPATPPSAPWSPKPPTPSAPAPVDIKTKLTMKLEWQEKNRKYFCTSDLWEISNISKFDLSFKKYNSLTKEEKDKNPNLFVEESGQIFDKFIYDWSEISISWNVATIPNWWVFTIKIATINWTDDIDDNLDNDDYIVYPISDIFSTESEKVSTKAQVMANQIVDNDANARTHILWIVSYDSRNVNIFANDELSNKYIDWNPNNIETDDSYVNISQKKKITKLPEAKLYFKILNKDSLTYKLEIKKIPKDSSNRPEREEVSPDPATWAIPTVFDFTKNYYQIFLKSEENVKWIAYKIYSENLDYINPIDDSKPWIIYIYQNHVFNHTWKELLIWDVFSAKK